MAGRATRVREALAGLWDELPLVARGVQGQLQDAIAVAVADLAVGPGRAEAVVARAAGADDELPDASTRIGLSRRVLRRKPLVVVLVAREHDIGVEVVQRLPDRPHRVGPAMAGSGAEERVMPVGQRARGWLRRQVLAQPLLLGRPGAAAAHP